MFILVARDRLAPDVVRHWAQLALEAGVPNEKVFEACAVAGQMDEWQQDHGSKVPD